MPRKLEHIERKSLTAQDLVAKLLHQGRRAPGFAAASGNTGAGSGQRLEMGDGMLKQRRTSKVAVSMLAIALSMLGLAGSALALSGEFTKFKYCPWTNPEVKRCAYAVTTGGEVVLGNKAVPIVNPVPLQGGYGAEAEEGPEAGFSKFYEATNKVTLAKVAQPIPGGLLGLVPPAGSRVTITRLTFSCLPGWS